MKTLMVLAAILPSIVFGDKLIIGGVSHHFESLAYKPNELHPSIGLERGYWETVAYRNSLGRTSLSAAFIKRPWSHKNLSLGYRVGLSSGYKPTKTCRSIPPQGLKKCKERRNSLYSYTKYGIAPQVHMLFTVKHERLSLDVGFSLVSYATIKLDL